MKKYHNVIGHFTPDTAGDYVLTTADGRELKLNQLGEDGWRIVSMLPTDRNALLVALVQEYEE
ncbi:MAG TPA: hypothetical protein VNJ51_09560 [Candidatus Dormibacteraeota bacterium]|nr:hypothetical protein [Candidatus Dormibacteraeota bacterium]